MKFSPSDAKWTEGNGSRASRWQQTISSPLAPVRCHLPGRLRQSLSVFDSHSPGRGAQSRLLWHTARAKPSHCERGDEEAAVERACRGEIENYSQKERRNDGAGGVGVGEGHERPADSCGQEEIETAERLQMWWREEREDEKCAARKEESWRDSLFSRCDAEPSSPPGRRPLLLLHLPPAPSSTTPSCVLRSCSTPPTYVLKEP